MTDIIVIGGGIAGLSAAARLSPEAEVLLLEAEEATGYHASGRSAALLERNYGPPSVQTLSMASADYLGTNDGGYLTPRGLMIVAKADERDAFLADCNTMALEEISPQDAHNIVPVLDISKVSYAGHQMDAQDIDTDRLMQGFVRQLRQNGGQILTRHRVEKIENANGQWTVTAAGNTYQAEQLVNAAGAWADQIAVMAGITPIGIEPRRRSMARIPAPNDLDVSKWPIFFGVGESWYAKPDAGSLLVSPADEDPVEPHDAWADDMTLAEGLARYEEMVDAPVTRLQASWAGLRSFAPDGTLVLGRDPHNPSFIWCAGQGGYGIQTSPAASQLIADLVLGRQSTLPSDVIAQLSPERYS